MGRFEEFGKRIDDEVARLKRMKNLQDFGKRVDEELERLKTFMKEDVAPETEKRTAQFLREVSEKLSEAASWLQERENPQSARRTCPKGHRAGRRERHGATDPLLCLLRRDIPKRATLPGTATLLTGGALRTAKSTTCTS